MEEEFVQTQEQLKPREERNEEDRTKVMPALFLWSVEVAQLDNSL